MKYFVLLMFLVLGIPAFAEEYIGADKPTFEVETGLRSAPHQLGAIVPKGWEGRKLKAPAFPATREALPAKFSWQDKLTPIRNQGNCGSCWAFSAQASIADVLALHGKGSLDLSEQFPVSCDTQSSGCGGGWPSTAFDLIKAQGDVLEADFPYKAVTGRCPSSLPHIYKLSSYTELASGVANPEDIKRAIYTYGPVSVAVAVAGSFDSYKSGIYNESASGSINHAVNLVGWDETATPNHWIMRNSWGPNWGENGYMRIAYGSRKIGYAATYVDIFGPVPHGPIPPPPTPTPGPTPDPKPTPCPECPECTFWQWLKNIF